MRHALTLSVLAALVAITPASGQTAAPDTATAKAQEASSALARGNPAMAAGLFTEALKDASLPNDRRAVILSDRAVAYGRMGQQRLAVEDFNRAAQLFPEYAAIYNNRGIALLALGQPREALKDFDRAILLTPGYAAAYHNRGSAHMRLGASPDAIRDYTKAIELMPGSAAPLSGRGRAFLAEARPHAAMRDFSRALQTDVRFASAYRSRAEAKLVVERFEEAVEDLSRAIAFEPANPEVYVLRGAAYLAARNAASAIKDFTRAIELDPKSVAAHEWRGLAHAKAEAYEEAEADLSLAIELDPRAVVAFAYRAFVYKATAQPELGLKEIDKAMKLDPSRAEVLWAKGEIEEALGRTEDAITSLRRSLVLKPSLKDAAEALERLGVAPDTSGDAEVAGAGIASWRVVKRGNAFFAVSSELVKLRVPLEMLGEGAPKLLDWEIRTQPAQGVATLRFHAGRSGRIDIEQVALIDLQANAVLGVQPHRVGDRLSVWTWDDTKVTVVSIDGVTDEFALRSAKPKEPVVALAPNPRRGADQNEIGSAKSTPFWAPWAQSGWGGGGQTTGQRPSQSQQRQGPKPKTLLDVLFGN